VRSLTYLTFFIGVLLHGQENCPVRITELESSSNVKAGLLAAWPEPVPAAHI
jgi:hypothetical protein